MLYNHLNMGYNSFMNERYIHPILWRPDQNQLSGIISSSGKKDDLWDLNQGSTLGKLKITSIEEFLIDLRQSNEYRISLGIPEMNYLAFSFDALGQGKIPNVIKLIEKGRELGYEVRGWVNQESAMLVICFATHDLSEDSGWDIYEWANINNDISDSYGHASWYEYCLFGVPIYDTWELKDRNNHLVAVAPDESKFAFFG